MDPRSVVLLLTTGCHLLVGALVLSHNPRGVGHRVVALQTVLLALWSAAMALTWLPNSGPHLVLYGRLTNAFAAFVCAGFVTIGVFFPDGRGDTPRFLHAAAWALGMGVALVALVSPSLVADGWLRDGELHAVYGPVKYGYFGYVLFCVSTGLGYLAARHRRAQGIRRLRIRYVFAGMGLVAGLNLPTDILGPLVGLSSGVWLGPLFSLVFVVTVAHAIVRRRLMGVRVFVGRRLVDLLAVTLSAGLTVGLLHLAALAFGSPKLTTSAVVVLAVALSYQKYRAALQHRLARYFSGSPYDYDTVVRSTSRGMAATLEVDDVLDCLLGTVVEALRVEHAVVLMPDAPASVYSVRRVHRARAELREPERNGLELAADSGLIAQLRAVRRPLVQGEALGARGAIPGGRRPENWAAVFEEMSCLHAEVAAPLLAGEILAAVLLVGPMLSGDGFTAQDTSLLSTLAAQAAVGITNSLLHQQALEAEKLARENTELYHQAQAANAAKDRMLAVVSHELRTPLTPILAGVGVLKSAPARDATEERMLEIIHQSASLQARLIDDLLDFARVSQGRLPLHRTMISLDTVLLAAVQAQRADAEQAELSLRVGEESGLYVHADADRLQQVVMNLLSNAIKFTLPGGEVRVRCAAQGPATARIVVEDTGIGIDAALREHLFEMFRQGDGVGQRKPGLGIGLALVRTMVELHGGRVWAESEGMGQGSRFTVELPTVPRPVACLPEPRPFETVGRRRVLLVEDNADTRMLLADALGKMGYEVHGTGSAEHALELAPLLRPDALLADVGLPGMDGCELLRRLRALPELESLVAFAVTPRPCDEDARRVRLAGYTGHFIKPVDLTVLHHVLYAALEGERPCR